MNRDFKLSKFLIKTKLLFLNLMTWAAFLLVVGVIVSSFFVVRNKLTEVSNRNMGSVIANSQTTRKLFKVFADIDQLSHTFYGKQDYLASEGKKMMNAVNKISESALDPDLKKSLLALFDTLDSFLYKGTTVNTALHNIESINRKTFDALTELENLIARLLVKLTLEGEDISFLEQLLTLVVGYRESLMQISKLSVELGYEHYFTPLKGNTSPLISAFDDLILRLRTVTATIPDIAWHGEKIVNNVKKYREAVLTLYAEMEGLGLQLYNVNHYRVLSMAVMESIDEKISKTTRLTVNSIEKIIRSSGIVVVVLSLLVIISVGFASAYLIRTNIRNPMMEILKSLELFGKGNFDTQIELDRKDEWDTIEKAFNQMAVDLQKSYAALQKAHDELEIRIEERTAKLAETSEELRKHRNHLEEMVETRTKELKDAQDELVRREKMAALGKLVATVAHEIRNPLGAVQNCVFSIGSAIKRKEMIQVDRALSLAEHNIQRCDGIITELLDFTRKKELKKASTEIDVWLEDLMNNYKLPDEIEYKLEMNSGIFISFDPRYLQRAIINIVTNAVQAMEEEKSPSKKLRLKTTVVKTKLEIRIGDTGPGIPADIRKKIFDLLFSTKNIGVGMGLAIVEDIMTKHGGGIEVESEVGKGTEVLLWLPIN